MASRELWQPRGAVFVRKRTTKTNTKENVIINRVHVNTEVGQEFSNTLLMVWLFTEMGFFMSFPSLFTGLDGVCYYPQIIRSL